MYSKGDFSITESLKINESISIIRQKMNLNLKNFQVDSTVIWLHKFKPWPYSNFGDLIGSQKRWFHFVDLNINSLLTKIEEH